MKKRIALLLSVCMTLGLLAGCSKKEESAPAPEAPAQEEQPAQEEKEPEAGDEKGDGKYTFGVSLFYRSDEFYVDIENMMKVYGEEAGVELIIQDANCDASTQMRQFEDFIQMGVDAILFSPCDPAACASAVEAANEAGIPVFTYDGTVEDNSGITSGMYSDFHADGYDAGTWAKKYIEENLGGKANVAILDYPASPIVCGQRADGFQEAVEELEGVKVVARQDGKATRTGGMEVMENILTANNNEVDLVFAINYESGAGAAAAIEAADAKGGVVCVAWGEEALQKVENNDPYLKGVLLGDPSDQAEIINVAKDYLDGKDIEKETYYSYYMVTSEDLNEKIDWKAIIDLRN
ncbi:MAG: sugar ABC transporter substrate-binding protein [Lachnospiraceae bacterium]|nr:sugar ABC transporter substrate-binding protein [Lachnospiraceae bacterium]MCI8996789.1 sugar ABC transporter substrate-binding protein [Lachnospiraceae bacterium]